MHREVFILIIDTIDNYKNYMGMGRVSDALEFVFKTDFTKTPLGRYELDGDNIYYSVQEYDTKPANNIAEAHVKHIDIQFIVEGEEYIGYAPISCDKKLYEEHPEDDYWLYECNTEKLTLKMGTFMIMYPNDIHQPGLAINDIPSKCRKVVVKVLVD